MFTKMFGKVLLEKYCTVVMIKEVEKSLFDEATKQKRTLLINRHRLNKSLGKG